jgi:methionyl-tRNA formyltransferase
LILPPAVLAAPRYGCLNIHASLLPRWRGAAPIQRAILEGDRETGVTIMQMAEGLDTGDMLLKYPVMIMPEDTAATIHDKLAELGATGILTALEQIESGTLKPEPQDDSQANYAAKLSKEEAVIDWCQDAEKIVRKIQAFNPWPVAQSLLDNQVVRIWEAGLDSGFQAGEPGVVLREDRQQGVLVQADHGAVWLKTLQLPGGKPLKAQDFLNGRSLLGKRFQTS